MRIMPIARVPQNRGILSNIIATLFVTIILWFAFIPIKDLLKSIGWAW